jgi:hypothetical protein
MASTVLSRISIAALELLVLPAVSGSSVTRRGDPALQRRRLPNFDAVDAVQAQLRAQASLPLRLGLLVAGIVLPLTVFATILVYYNYETSRRTAYDQVLQIARGVATNVDQEFRTAIASLQVLALSETLERGDLDGFRKQAEHFLEVHFPRSNVVVTDAGGQQLLNTAVPPGAPLPTYVRMDALRRVFTERGGAIVPPPTRRGFGSTLIQQSIERELNGSFRNDFESQGLTCGISLPLAKVRA